MDMIFDGIFYFYDSYAASNYSLVVLLKYFINGAFDISKFVFLIDFYFDDILRLLVQNILIFHSNMIKTPFKNLFVE